MKIVLVIILVIVLLALLNIVLGVFLALHNRRCPYCGKRMKHMRDKRDAAGHVEEYVFHCSHCGAWEQVTPVELIREQHE